jgi:hypothetical protein
MAAQVAADLEQYAAARVWAPHARACLAAIASPIDIDASTSDSNQQQSATATAVLDLLRSLIDEARLSAATASPASSAALAPLASSSSSLSSSSSSSVDPAAALLASVVGSETPLASIAALALSNPRAKCELALFSNGFVFYPASAAPAKPAASSSSSSSSATAAAAAASSATPMCALYSNIARILALPRANGEFTLAIGLKQPLRQGKSDYEHLLIAFKKGERCVSFFCPFFANFPIPLL